VDREVTVGGGRIMKITIRYRATILRKKVADCSGLRCFIWTDPSADLKSVSMIQEAVETPCHNARTSNIRSTRPQALVYIVTLCLSSSSTNLVAVQKARGQWRIVNNNNNVRLLQLQSERYNYNSTNICHAGQH